MRYSFIQKNSTGPPPSFLNESRMSPVVISAAEILRMQHAMSSSLAQSTPFFLNSAGSFTDSWLWMRWRHRHAQIDRPNRNKRNTQCAFRAGNAAAHAYFLIELCDGISSIPETVRV
jgi:hypothetical protein